MNTSTIYIVILYFILNYLITFQRYKGYNLMENSYDNGNIMSTKIKDYSELFQKKFDYIREKTNIFTPANEDILKIFENRTKENFGVKEAFITTLITPGNLIGYKPMTPYTDTTEKICLQIEQGSMGWYWLYGTFSNTKDCFLLQLNRLDTIPTELRESLGYKLGDTTIYSLTLGIGNGKEYYFGNIYFEGSLNISNNIKFSIISKDNTVSFSHDLDNMSVNVKNMLLTNNSDNNDTKIFNFTCSCKNNFEMYLNQPNGCEPCGFINSSYQSYTNLYIDVNYTTNKGDSKNLQKGYGWMDHQWGNGEIDSIFYKSLTSILNKGNLYTGLPPYVWLNIRLNDNLQYMIFSLLSNIPKKGDVIKCYINTYKPSGVTFFNNNKIDVKILDTVELNGTNYPTKYEVNIDELKYVLDSTPYGNTLFLDALNTNHWGGSCDVLLNNNQVGTGFLEAQRFDGDLKSIQKNFELLNITNPNVYQKYYNTKNTTTLIASYLLYSILFVLFTILLYKFVKNSYNFIKTTNYGKTSEDLRKILYVLFYLLLSLFLVYLIYYIIRGIVVSENTNKRF